MTAAPQTLPAALQADFAEVFDGADFTLLAATAAVVALLLVVTYRSPVLWLVPLLAKLSESGELPAIGQKMLRNDILASNLYMSVVTDKYKTAFLNEYRQGILKV